MDELRSVLVARTRIELANLDYRRAVKRLVAEGCTQAAIAQVVGVSQPAIAQVLRRSKDVTFPVEGFAGASPLEICQRYAVGELEHDDAVAQLARWDYPAAEPPVFGDDLSWEPPGGWDEVELACFRGLIDDDFIDEVQAEQERLGGRLIGEG